jgi:hypothetical protein
VADARGGHSLSTPNVFVDLKVGQAGAEGSVQARPLPAPPNPAGDEADPTGRKRDAFGALVLRARRGRVFQQSESRLT